MPDIKGSNDLTKHLLVGISEIGCRAWRNNIGGAYPIQTVKAAIGMLCRGDAAGCLSFLRRARPMIFGGLPGLPDIMGIMPGGRLLGVEVKWGNDTQNDDQKVCQSIFDQLGALYIIARDYDDAIAAIRKELQARIGSPTKERMS